MEYLINIDGIDPTILPGAVTSFSFTTDIHYLYSICRIVVQDCLQVYFSKIKIGQPATVTFLDESNTYINNMAVLSYQKIPQAVGIATDQIEIRLISDFYFSQLPTYTEYHEGNVEAIISSILSKKFPNIPLEAKDIQPTTDIPAPRYQIARRYQDFMVDLLSFASVEDLPVFLYSDHKGVLHLRGIADVWNRSVDDAPLLLTGRDADVNGDINENISTKRIYMRSYRVIGDGENSANRVKGFSVKANFLDPHGTQDVTVYSASGKYNPQSIKESPSKDLFYGWEVTPQDARTKLIREGFNQNKSMFAIDATANGFIGGDLAVMSGVRVLVPYKSRESRSDGTPIVLGDGLYIVTGLQYVVEAPRNLKFTRMTLLQASC